MPVMAALLSVVVICSYLSVSARYQTHSVGRFRWPNSNNLNA
ncbi:hypothetical protein CZ787_17045 [Halomonas citrativorans]|uniref:Uncharacterized protein n=1 Tax=Halomonas citrativorans TaxID=2742612 RepID=A0A1R4I4W2_9GAMM|nr:hypothetical protein CZ787_17045 [Halomonas citrativorans]